VKLYSLALLVTGYGTLLAALSLFGSGHAASSDPIRFAGFLVAAALAGFLQIRLRGLATRLSVRFFVLLIGLPMLSWPEVAVIACLSAIVESLVWTTPRPTATSTALNGAAAVLATSTVLHNRASRKASSVNSTSMRPSSTSRICAGRAWCFIRLPADGLVVPR